VNKATVVKKAITQSPGLALLMKLTPKGSALLMKSLLHLSPRLTPSGSNLMHGWVRALWQPGYCLAVRRVVVLYRDIGSSVNQIPWSNNMIKKQHT
jgi:hypothetical protein